MKTRIIILSAIILSIIGCSDQKTGLAELVGLDGISAEKKNDLTRLGLKGKVSSCKVFSYSDSFAPQEAKKAYKYDEHKYNEQGNKIEVNRYNPDGILDSKATYKYEYDEQGNKIERHENDRVTSKKWTYKYDEQDNMIESNLYHFGGPKPKWRLKEKKTFNYDEQGNMIEENFWQGDGRLDYKWIYKHDDQGNMIERIEGRRDGSVRGKNTYKYDDQGNMTEDKHYKRGGTLNLRLTYKYEYDNKGNWIKKTQSYFQGKKTQNPMLIYIERVFEYYP